MSYDITIKVALSLQLQPVPPHLLVTHGGWQVLVVHDVLPHGVQYTPRLLKEQLAVPLGVQVVQSANRHDTIVYIYIMPWSLNSISRKPFRYFLENVYVNMSHFVVLVLVYITCW